MSQLDRMRQWIALGRVNEEGDAQTRELVERLRADREAVGRENQSLHGQNQSLQGENAALQDTVTDMYRTGLSPGARHVVGWNVVALVLVSALTGVVLWLGGVAPVIHALRTSVGAEPAPIRAGPSWVGDVISFTAVGPPEILTAVTNRFKVMPTSIDTGTGTLLTLKYVDGPYSRLEGDAQREQALAIARFVWRLPLRPRGTEVIKVRVERPMRAVGDVGVTTEQIFLPIELNAPK